MNTFFIAIASIALSVAAQFSLKAGMSSATVREALAQSDGLRTLFAVFTNLSILGGFLLYGLGAIVWLAVLSKWDVSKAYPLVGLGFVFSMLLSTFFFNEQFGFQRVAGTMLIVLGIVLVSRS